MLIILTKKIAFIIPFQPLLCKEETVKLPFTYKGNGGKSVAPSFIEGGARPE
jgi:hypothetical protein